MSYVDDYVSRLNAIKAARTSNAMAGLPSGASTSQLANLILSKAHSDFGPSAPVAKKEEDSRGIWGGVKSVGQGVLDILSRPLYGVGEAVDSAINEPDPNAGKVLKGAWEGVSGKEKTDWISVIKERVAAHPTGATAEVIKNLEAEGKSEEAQQVRDKYRKDTEESNVLSGAGLGLDLVLDPINLVPGGFFTKPFTMAAKLVKTGDALKASEEVLGLTKAAEGAPSPGSVPTSQGSQAADAEINGLLDNIPNSADNVERINGGIPMPGGVRVPPAAFVPQESGITNPASYKMPVKVNSANVPFGRVNVPNLPEYVTDVTKQDVTRTIPGGTRVAKPASKQRKSIANILAPAAGLGKPAAKAGPLAEPTEDLIHQAEQVVTARRIRMRNGMPPVMTPQESAFANIWDDIAGATGRGKTDLSHLTPQKLGQELSDEAAGIRLSKKNAKGSIVSGPTVALNAIHRYLTTGEGAEQLADMYVKYNGEKVPLRDVKNTADAEANSGEYLLRVKSERNKFARADPAKDPTGKGMQSLLRGVAQYELNPQRYAYRELENPEFFNEFRKVETGLRRRGINDANFLADVKDSYADVVAANKGKPLAQAEFTKFLENAIDEIDPDLLGPKSVLEEMPEKVVKETVTKENKIFPDKEYAGIANALRNDNRFVELPNVLSGAVSSKAFSKTQAAKVIDEAAALTQEAAQGSEEAINALKAPVAKPISPDEAASVTGVVAKTIDAIKKSSIVKSATNTRPRHKAYNAPKQSNLSNMLATEAGKILQTNNPKILNPHSPKFIPAVYGSYTRMLKASEDALIATADDINMPRLGNGANGSYIRLSDVLDKLGPTLGRQVVFGPKGKVLVTKLLNAIDGDKAALKAVETSNHDVFAEVMLTDWTGIMSKEYALRTIADTNKAKTVVDDAADAIQAKATDPLLSDSAKQVGVEDIQNIAKSALKGSMPETKRSISDLLKTIGENAKYAPNADAAKSIPDQIMDARKTKLAAGLLKPKEAQAPRIETVNAVNKEIAGDISHAKYDPELAAHLGESGIFSTVLKWFNPAFGYATLRPLLLKNIGVRKASAAVRAHDIKQIFKTVDQARHPELWDAATGKIPAADDVIERASMMINKIMGNMFIESGLLDAAVGNTAMARSGVSLVDLNRHFKIVGLDNISFGAKHIDDVTKKEINLQGLGILDSWRYMKTPTNPQEFMFRISQAVENVMTEYSTWANVGDLFGSVKPLKNTVEVANMHPAIDGMHFDPKIAQEMSKIAHGIDEFYEPLSNNTFLKLYDQVLRTWKSGVTVYAPSHHIRNMVGDMFMGWLDGVSNPKYYSRAGKMILSNRHAYSDVIGSDKLPLSQLVGAGREREIIDEMMVGGRMPKSTDTMATARVKGKTFKMTSNQIYQMAFRHGLLPHSNVIEDLPGSETLMEALARKNPAAKRVFQPLGGRGQVAAREVSESREHLARMAHYLHAIENTKADSLEDLFYKAAQRVRKYHPDGLDLTKAEQQVMRRLLPFYSWTRKAIPLILEGIVTQPHKVMAYPKIMHGLAESQGITDTDISNPYPTDQLFPDWLAGNVIGPTFGPEDALSKYFAQDPENAGYTMLNPGNPATDIMEDFFNNPAKGLLGSLTPAIRMPMEMLSGTDLQTGAPIKDKTEYLDKNIPMLSTASRITNGGLGTGLLEGGDLKGKESQPFNEAAFINYLTAAGILDTSKYIKGGEFDLREYLRKQSAGTN